MIILGIDSSTDRLGIGVADNDRILHEDVLDSSREHASQIIGMIETVLEKLSLSAENLDGIAVADGPGSFTGLRIGMAAAKGMALALDIPIVGVSTFEVIARRLSSEYDKFYLSAIVRKGEMYLCRVKGENSIRENIILIDQDDIPDIVNSDPVGLIGNEPEGWEEQISNRIPAEKVSISGGELALYGSGLIEAGKVSDLATLEPFYIAPSQAESKFGK